MSYAMQVIILYIASKKTNATNWVRKMTPSSLQTSDKKIRVGDFSGQQLDRVRKTESQIFFILTQFLNMLFRKQRWLTLNWMSGYSKFAKQ